MASLTELARFHTTVDGPALGHLQRLVAGWGLLADFCFADLLLFAPTNDAEDGDRFVVLGQVRPSTSQTVYRADLDRHHRRREGAAARHPRLPARRDHRGRDHHRRPQGAGAGAVHPGAVPRRGDRGAHPRVGTVVRSAAGRARAHLRRDLQPLRPDDRRGRLPVRRRGPRDRGGAAGRRRGDPARCGAAGRVHLAQRRVGAAPHRRARQRRGVCASTSSVSTTRRCAPRSRSRHPSPRRSRAAPRSPCSSAASR